LIKTFQEEANSASSQLARKNSTMEEDDMVNLDSFAFWLLADNFKRSANVRCTRRREYSSFNLFIICFMFVLCLLGLFVMIVFLFSFSLPVCAGVYVTGGASGATRLRGGPVRQVPATVAVRRLARRRECTP
jgi:hypothetical protein